MSPQTANHMRLDGKVAVITGGAQGVGLGIAQEFVDYGATVIIADINEETLKRAGAALGPKVTTVVVDVTDRAPRRRVAPGPGPEEDPSSTSR